MIRKEFKYNPVAGYPSSSAYTYKHNIDIINQKIHVTSDGKHFNAQFTYLFEKYILPPVNNSADITRWNTNAIDFWQNQLNFAIWCATTGCGVDITNHINGSGLSGSFFKFHVYYQTRRILIEMAAALPQNKTWNALNNTYNRKAYERICSEFNVDKNADWRIKGDNHGFGKPYENWPNPAGYREANRGHIPSNYIFASNSPSGRFDILFIKQDPSVALSWTTLILDKSDGFTKAGVERINDSIRTFCWAILGSQSQTRTNIIGTGTAFDAQKQFIANVEDAINSSVNLPDQISRHEDVLKYARSKVDFVFGTGLYMAPSNMELEIGASIQGYNNKIVIATAEQALGLNNSVNLTPIPPVINHTVKGTLTPGGTYNKHVVNLPPADKTLPNNRKVVSHIIPHESSPITHPLLHDSELTHSEKKTAIIFGSMMIGIMAFAVYKFT